jgi:hypothetical protein
MLLVLFQETASSTVVILLSWRMRMSGLAVVTALSGGTIAGGDLQALWFGRSPNTLVAADRRNFMNFKKELPPFGF